MDSQINFKDEVVQLITIKDDWMLEATVEGINFWSLLKNDKISVWCYCRTDVSSLEPFTKSFTSFFPDKNGVWIWTKPITWPNKNKLIVLQTQTLPGKDSDNVAHQWFILSVLISNCVIFDYSNLKNSSFFLDYALIQDKIQVSHNENRRVEASEHILSKFLPWLVWWNNVDTDIDSALNKVYTKISSFKIVDNSYTSLIDTIKENIAFKQINDTIIDGENLFGWMQNYLDSLNNDEKPNINSALENILLSKAKNISDKNFEAFKASFTKLLEDKYPLNYHEIYKLYFIEEDKEIEKWCGDTSDWVTVKQNGDYIRKLFHLMRNELENIMEINNSCYEEWYDSEVNDFQKVISWYMNIDDIKDIGEINDFLSGYVEEIQKFFTKIINMPHSTEFCKNWINAINKVVNEHICGLWNNLKNKIEEWHTISFNNISNEWKVNMELSRKNSEEYSKYKKLFDDCNKEKVELSKELIDVKSKSEKWVWELKIKEQEATNSLNREMQKYQQLEKYEMSQIKEKEGEIAAWKDKNAHLLKEWTDMKRTWNENNNEMSKLKEMIDNKGNIVNNGTSGTDNEGRNSGKTKNESIWWWFKNLQITFSEFKSALEKVSIDNENAFKTKYLEASTKEIENKSHNWIEEIKIFREDQIRSLSENYEMSLKKAKDEIEMWQFNLAKVKWDWQESNNINKWNQEKINDMQNQINLIEETCRLKDGWMVKQKERVNWIEKEINLWQKSKEDWEMNLNKNIWNYRMKEDEIDTLIMVIDGILSKRKDKYEHNISRWSHETKINVEIISKAYKVFNNK